MGSYIRRRWFIGLMALVAVFAGVGRAHSGAPAPQSLTVSFSRAVIPSTLTVLPGQVLGCSVDSGSGQCTSSDGCTADSVTSYVWSCSGGTITTSNGATVWTAPSAAGTYTITCTMDDMPAAVVAPDCGSRDDVSVARSVTVIVPSYSLSIRRSGATVQVTDPNTGVTTTQPAPYTFSATVAAGGLATQPHEADVLITVTDDKGNPLAGVPPPAVAVSQGSGYTVAAAVAFAPGVTSNPSGNINGTFVSGDIVTSGLALTVGAASATVAQDWNDTGNKAWEYDPYFYVDVASNVQFSPCIADTYGLAAISGHTMKLVVTHVDGTYIDDNGDDQYYSLDSDPNSPDPVDLSPYAAFDNTIERPSGVYSANLTIYDESVDNVEFDAIDETIYL